MPENSSGVDAAAGAPRPRWKRSLGWIWNVGLFLTTGYAGISALIHHRDAGWIAGFVFCASGSWIADHLPATDAAAAGAASNPKV
jgi:hypothetical protein